MSRSTQGAAWLVLGTMGSTLAMAAEPLAVPMAGTYVDFDEAAGDGGSTAAYGVLGLRFGGARVAPRDDRDGHWLAATGESLQIALRDRQDIEARSLPALSFELRTQATQRFRIAIFGIDGRLLAQQVETVTASRRIELQHGALSRVSVEAQGRALWGIDSLLLGDGPLPAAVGDAVLRACSIYTASGMPNDQTVLAVLHAGQSTVRMGGPNGCATMPLASTGQSVIELAGVFNAPFVSCLTVDWSPLADFMMEFYALLYFTPYAASGTVQTDAQGCVPIPVTNNVGVFSYTGVYEP